jgi:hypothetical protein
MLRRTTSKVQQDCAETEELSFRKTHIFYPDAEPDLCTVALFVIDTVALVRGRRPTGEQSPPSVPDL